MSNLDVSCLHAGNVIQTIINEIEQQCRLKDVVVSETVVAFVVKAIIINPANKFDPQQTLNKEDTKRLIQLCIERILDNSLPTLDTIQMQVFFDMNYVKREEYAEEQCVELKERTGSLMNQIVGLKPVFSDHFENLLQIIVSFIILRNNLGELNNELCRLETEVALKSILPQAELERFAALSDKYKTIIAIELTSVVNGIRIFNRENNKGGSYIEDVPNILNQLIPSLADEIDRSVEESHKYITRYQDAFECIRRDPTYMMVNFTEQLKTSIINASQLEIFLKVIKNEMIKGAKRVTKLLDEFSAKLKHLQNTIQNRSSVPSSQVYSYFAQLTYIWTGFQNELNYTKHLQCIIPKLDQFSQIRMKILPTDKLEPYVRKYQEIQEADMTLNTVPPETLLIEPRKDDIFEVLDESSIPNFNISFLQFRGYCCWSLVIRERYLVEGNSKIGIIKYRDKLYVFTSKIAADDFIADPEIYIREVLECAKRSPVLIQILDLYRYFSNFVTCSPLSKASTTERRFPQKTEMSSQTETHFYETKIDPSYEWNEWELRRRAIKLANLRQKMTKSAQTEESSMRRDNATQVYELKDTSSQTKKDNYTSIPKPKVFLAGLRGTNPLDFVKVDLTLNDDKLF